MAGPVRRLTHGRPSLKNRSRIAETRAYAAVCTATELGFSFVPGSQRAMAVETAPSAGGTLRHIRDRVEGPAGCPVRTLATREGCLVVPWLASEVMGSAALRSAN